MKTVLLFDIDGTLLDSGGAGQHAMEMALLEVFQVEGPYTDIPAAGRTDRAITTDLFNHHSLSTDEPNWTRFLEAYLEHLPRALREMNGTILPGVETLLRELSSRDDLALGLLTGNLAVGAQMKLRHFEIDHYFQFGGFGDSHFDRDDVARLARDAAMKYLEDRFHPDRVWVIGDTPADVKCGRAIGAKVLAVGTGIHSMDHLESSKPDLLFESLADVDRVMASMLN